MTEFLHDRRDVLPVRPANLRDEVRLLDLQRRPGVAVPLQQQGLRGPLRLLEVRNLGHCRGDRKLHFIAWELAYSVFQTIYWSQVTGVKMSFLDIVEVTDR